MARPLSKDTAYARANGVNPRLVRLLGGSEKLASLSPEARDFLLKPNYGFSRNLRKGGLIARGMKRAMDIRSQP